MTYDSSQLMNIVLNAGAYFNSFYPALNMNNLRTPDPSNPFGPFNNTANIKIVPMTYYSLNSNSNTSSSSSSGSLHDQMLRDLYSNDNTTSSSRRSYLSLGSTTPSCLTAVRLAEAEYQKGVREIGSSNDSIDIRKYKNGARNNHQWCGYFTSWLYGSGQGTNNNSTFGFTGSSQAIKKRAIDAGCYAYKNSGYTPKVGDLAMWTKTASTGHVGIVTKVYSDGSFDVIEGNSGNKVAKHHYSSQSSVGRTFNGFVKMNEWTA